ncbi:hypothetical protein PIB30_059807, partial [Stylosanthes scabra]|nr:hypothetical protein [Stylosanthes scabra]
SSSIFSKSKLTNSPEYYYNFCTPYKKYTKYYHRIFTLPYTRTLHYPPVGTIPISGIDINLLIDPSSSIPQQPIAATNTHPMMTRSKA